MKTATKIVFLVCLFCVTALPVMRWVITPDVDLGGLATFVVACAGPLGVLTGAMVTGKFAAKRNGVDANTEK